jgi:hypothetical protein
MDKESKGNLGLAILGHHHAMFMQQGVNMVLRAMIGGVAVEELGRASPR